MTTFLPRGGRGGGWVAEVAIFPSLGEGIDWDPKRRQRFRWASASTPEGHQQLEKKGGLGAAAKTCDELEKTLKSWERFWKINAKETLGQLHRLDSFMCACKNITGAWEPSESLSGVAAKTCKPWDVIEHTFEREEHFENIKNTIRATATTWNRLETRSKNIYNHMTTNLEEKTVCRQLPTVADRFWPTKRKRSATVGNSQQTFVVSLFLQLFSSFLRVHLKLFHFFCRRPNVFSCMFSSSVASSTPKSITVASLFDEELALFENDGGKQCIEIRWFVFLRIVDIIVWLFALVLFLCWWWVLVSKHKVMQQAYTFNALSVPLLTPVFTEYDYKWMAALSDCVWWIHIARTARNQQQLPFGGLQLVLPKPWQARLCRVLNSN